MQLIEPFVPVSTAEYEMCRMQITNSTTKQLRHYLASFCSELHIISNNLVPVYENYISNAGCTWSLTGSYLNIMNIITVFVRGFEPNFETDSV